MRAFRTLAIVPFSALLVLVGVASAETAPTTEANRLIARARALRDAGSYTEALSAITDALRLAEQSDDIDLVRDSLQTRFELYFSEENWSSAARDADRLVELTSKSTVPDDHGLLLMRENQARVYARLNRNRESEAIYRDVIDIARNSKNHSSMSVAARIWNLATMHERRGDFGAALRWYREYVAVEGSARPMGEGVGGGHLAVGAVLAELNRIEEAEEEYARSIGILSGTDDLVTLARAHESRGALWCAAGRREEGLAELRLARDLLGRAVGVRSQFMGEFLERFAKLAEASGFAADAADAREEARSIFAVRADRTNPPEQHATP